MNGVILAAGEGTRLQPRTHDRPKPLVEVAGRPILEYSFETLLEAGITDAVVVVGYKKDEIIDRYGDSYRDLELEYAHQAERDGLAHAVLAAEPYVDDPFVVLNGDNVYNADLSSVVDAHATTDASITFPVTEVSSTVAKEGAVCEFDDDGAVVGLVEKPADPPSRRVPGAIYVLPPAVFSACDIVKPSARGEYELADAIDLLLYADYSAETVPFDGWKVNINTEQDIERAETRLTEEN
jgi:glucose-1-phosphate thymidylyltransferase